MEANEAMKADLSERLRAYRPYRIGEGEWFGPKVCEEAADELSALRERVAAVENKLRMVVSHATGGTCSDIELSTNDICVRITALRNKIYGDGKKEAVRAILAKQGGEVGHG